MSAATIRAVLAAAALATAASTNAVGLGPLVKAGLTDGPAKAFYLTLINPYEVRTAFSVYAVGRDAETAQPRVQVPAMPLAVSKKSSRRFMIVVNGLEPGETYDFRLCAEKTDRKDDQIHARVCSRITARRVAARA